MPGFILSCCSTTDMPRNFFEERNIPFVCFSYIMDGAEYPDDLGRTMPFDEFYARISAGATPTTSQVSVGQFLSLFEPLLEAGNDILHITLSSGISGTYGSACVARDTLAEKYPGRKLYIVDSLAASSGYGLLVDMVCDMRDKGEDIDKAFAETEKLKMHIHHWFFTSDLTHLHRGGRISAASAVFGTVLHICPLLNVDFEGNLIPRTKYRGKKRVIEETVKRMVEHAKDGINYSGKCFISNSACYEDARIVADMIEERFKNLKGKVMINSIGTVIGSHTGPGTVALFFEGDKRED